MIYRPNLAPPKLHTLANSINPKATKRFSIRLKLLLIFTLLIATSVLTLGLLAFNIAERAVNEKIETHLIDKAGDVAEIMDGRVEALYQL